MKNLMILSIIALLSFSATSMFAQPTPKVTGDETQTVSNDYNSQPACNTKKGKQKHGKQVQNKKHKASHGKKVKNRNNKKGKKGTKCRRQSAKVSSKGKRGKGCRKQSAKVSSKGKGNKGCRKQSAKVTSKGKKGKHHAGKRKSHTNS